MNFKLFKLLRRKAICFNYNSNTLEEKDYFVRLGDKIGIMSLSKIDPEKLFSNKREIEVLTTETDETIYLFFDNSDVPIESQILYKENDSLLLVQSIETNEAFTVDLRMGET